MKVRSLVVVGVLGLCSACDGTAASLDAPSADAPPDAKPPPPVCTKTVITSGLGEASAIDEMGNIAGWYRTGEGATHAFRWHASSGFVDLGAPVDGFSKAYGISGEFTVGIAGVVPTSQPFLSDSTGMHMIPLTHAYAVNSSGVVVGDLVTGNVTKAVRYEAGTVTELGTMVSAYAITDDGVIAGYESGAGGDVAVTWSAGVITRLGSGRATAINQSATSVVDGNTIYHQGIPTTLGVPYDIASCAVSSATLAGVNDTGWVVGSAYCQATPQSVGTEKPTLYYSGVGRDINGLLTNPPVDGYASAVNNHGQIAVNYGRRGMTGLMSITCSTPGS